MTILANMTPAQRAEFLAAGDTSGLLTKDQAATGTGVKADGLVGSAAAQVAGIRPIPAHPNRQGSILDKSSWSDPELILTA